MHIATTGMACPVGNTAESSCAAIRAGIAGFAELPFRNDDHEPIIGAPMPWIDFELTHVKRQARMLALSIDECLSKADLVSTETLPLIIGVAEAERPGVSKATASQLMREIEQLLGTRFHHRLSGMLATGHTAAFEALRFAARYFSQEAAEACVVCAVDSYVNARALGWLSDTQRLKTHSNSDGMVPGEAAAALLMRPGDGADGHVSVEGLGFAQEGATVLGREPLLADGLVGAAREALKDAGRDMHDIAFRVSDINGESYAFKEQSLMLSRVLRVRRDEFPLWHYADSVGDTGAAAGACGLVVADRALLRRYAPGNSAICFASGLSGRRAAVVLRQGASR